MKTSTHGNFQHAMAANVHRRATAGVGIIATPYFPYDDSSVWNRNQLGGMGALGITDILLYGMVAYGLWWFLKRRGIA